MKFFGMIEPCKRADCFRCFQDDIFFYVLSSYIETTVCSRKDIRIKNCIRSGFFRLYFFCVFQCPANLICIFGNRYRPLLSGMLTKYDFPFAFSVGKILLCPLAGCYSELALRRALRNSSMLSSDVSAGYDPAYGEAFEKKNAAYLGRGIVLNKFTGARGKSGSNDANAEYVARVRRIFDDHNVAFQTAELGKVDFGGGGTIAYIAALYGMEVIDSGVAVLSMHAPWEVTSKADVYEAYKAYKAFLLDA